MRAVTPAPVAAPAAAKIAKVVLDMADFSPYIPSQRKLDEADGLLAAVPYLYLSLYFPLELSRSTWQMT